jgi:hypothetical protein
LTLEDSASGLASTSSYHFGINRLKPKRERERVRKDSIRVEEKRKHLGESERRFISEGEKRASC